MAQAVYHYIKNYSNFGKIGISYDAIGNMIKESLKDVKNVVQIGDANQNHSLDAAVAQTCGKGTVVIQILLHQLGYHEAADQLKESGGESQGEGKQEAIVFTEGSKPGLGLQGCEDGQTDEQLGDNEAGCAKKPGGDQLAALSAVGKHGNQDDGQQKTHK